MIQVTRRPLFVFLSFSALFYLREHRRARVITAAEAAAAAVVAVSKLSMFV